MIDRSTKYPWIEHGTDVKYEVSALRAKLTENFYDPTERLATVGIPTVWTDVETGVQVLLDAQLSDAGSAGWLTPYIWITYRDGLTAATVPGVERLEIDGFGPVVDVAFGEGWRATSQWAEELRVKVRAWIGAGGPQETAESSGAAT